MKTLQLGAFYAVFADFHAKFPDFVFNMADFVFNIADFVFNIDDFVLNIADFVFNIADFVFNIADFVFNIADFVFNIADFVVNIADFVFNIADFVLTSGGVPLPILSSHRAAFRCRFCVHIGRRSAADFQFNIPDSKIHFEPNTKLWAMDVFLGSAAYAGFFFRLRKQKNVSAC
ncbi:MAG: hypothetical protein CFE22_17445 [Cytophagaceae bacterium BCCC1]|nr:MAG: hypothetical protein CFE22_17445 [Cytophagaceae bacterium BCCC1]